MINAIKALLQMQNGFLQLESTLPKVHSRWIFPAKLLSRCKPAPPFLVIFTLSCFIRDRAI
jgi:hypothetical protein